MSSASSSSVDLEFPVLIEAIKRQYHIQPLLFPGIQCSHRRYEGALEKFHKAVHKQYKNKELDPDILTEILWYGFNPECRLEFREFEIQFQKQRTQGRFAVVFYSLKTLHYACFPKLHHLTLILPEQRELREEALFPAVQQFFRQLLRDADKAGEEVHFGSYQSPKNALINRLTLGLTLPVAAFAFEQNREDLFEFLQTHQRLRGEVELSKVGRDLNEDYPDGLATAYGRAAWVDTLTDQIYQPHPTCLALIGARGSGKTTLIQAAVKQHLQRNPGKPLSHQQQLWWVDPLRIISGMSVVGMWQRRVEAIINQIRNRLKMQHQIHQTDLVYLDNVVALFRVGKSAQNNLTLADVLKPYLEKRAFTLMVEATPEEWQKAQALDRKFTDLFEVLRLEAAPPDLVITQLVAQRHELEKQFNCEFSVEAMAALWQLRQHFAGGEVLPGALVRVMKQVANRSQGKIIDKAAIFSDYKASHKFRELIFNPDLPLTAAQIKTELDAQLVGQERVKTSLINVIQVIKARLAAPHKPLASLLFIGPTGVGKTEAAKVLTRFLFADDKQLVRFDMNEFVDDYALARLLGNPRQPEGQLTSQVRSRKTCVLLLDEIEKAHPLVHDLLLQVLGEGRLTDSLGRTTDFTQCVVIMTSNLGSHQAAHPIGFNRSLQDQSHSYLQAVKRFFRPEFFNRLDEAVIFEPLSLPQAMELTQQQIRKLLARNGFTRRTMFFNVNAVTLELITQTGFDPEMGGRALKRSIERSLTALSADQLVTLQPEKPVLLEIYRDQQQLLPHLTALDYEPTVSTPLTLTPVNQLDTAIVHLGSEIEQFEDQLNQQIDQASPVLRLEYWSLKERLMDLKNTVSSLCWDVATWKAQHNPDYFQVKQKSRLNNAWRLDKGGRYDLHAKQSLGDYFQEIYNSALSLRDLTNYFLLQQQQEYAYIQLMFQTMGTQPERVGLVITPLIESYPDAARFFLQQYQTLLSHLLIHDLECFQHHNHQYLIASGHGLYRLLAAESGVHLLQQPQLLPFQIRVDRLQPGQAIQDFILTHAILDQLPPQRPHPGNIIRLYTLTTPTSLLMTDFRTGLMCQDALSEEDWKLLLISRQPLPPDSERP